MRILFQGDSVTDGGRDYGNIHSLGNGYPKYAAEQLQNRHPEIEFEFINLGIAGHCTEQLYARWQSDAVDLQPDVISILIGFNDTWKRKEEGNWLPNAAFEENYRRILTDIKTKTKAKIIMLEEFLLPVPDKDFLRVDVDPKIQVTRKLAREFADAFIPLDGIFAAHCIKQEPTIWAGDGLHPTKEGSKLIADYYADAFDMIFASI